jgi:hypothetical protein
MPLKKVEERALQVAPETAAISLIDDVEELEEELSEVFRDLLAGNASAVTRG